MNTDLQNTEEQEMLGKDEQAVGPLVAHLRRVEAPANFERRVMSKIAEGVPVRRSTFSVSALAYGISFVVVLFIATVVILKLRQPTVAQPDSVAMSSPVVPSQQNNAGENVPSVIPNEQPTTVAQSEPPVQPVANVVPRKSDGVVIANSNVNRGGGSYDEALPQKKAPLPAGIGAPNPTSNANRSDVISTTPIPVQEMLSIVLGVSVDYADGWKVSSVSKNSVAQRAGIEPGDVIVSLDDKDLTAISQFQGSGSISKIGFKRNGIIKTVKLK